MDRPRKQSEGGRRIVSLISGSDGHQRGRGVTVRKSEYDRRSPVQGIGDADDFSLANSETS